jgi:type VI secretion system secreted protein Hcp
VADSILMKIGDGSKISGETLIKGYEAYIECLSYSHGVSMQMTDGVSNTKRTSGKPNFQDFVISKYMDKATPSFNQYCTQSTDLGDVTITILQNDQGAQIEMMKYTLKNTLVSSISVGGGGGGVPSETITFNYSAINWDYKPQKTAGTAAGTASAAWDIAANAVPAA